MPLLLLVPILLVSLLSDLAGQKLLTGKDEKPSFLVRHWDIESGIPQNTVKAIRQTQDGYIWVGTFGGIVRFDGSKFTLFNSSNIPGLETDRVLTMAEYDGVLWIGFERGGIFHYKNGEFTRFNLPGAGIEQTVLSLVRDGEGGVWIQTFDYGILRYKDGGFTQYDSSHGVPQVYSLFKNRQGIIHLATDKVCLWFEGSRFIPSVYDFSGGGELSIPPFFDREGKLWISRREKGITLHSPDGSKKTFPFRLASTWIRKFHQEDDGLIWMASDKGLYIYDGKNLFVYTTEDGLSDNEILSIERDREGNYWLGSKTNGLMQLRRNQVKTFIREGEEEFNNFTSLIKTKSGRVLAGLNCGGIYILEPEGRLRFLLDKNKMTNVCVWSLFEDSQGSLWMGTWGEGVFRVKNWERAYRSGSVRAEKVAEVKGNVILAMAEDIYNNLWFGTLNGGIIQLSPGGKTRRFTTAEGLASNEIRTIFIEKDGAVLTGTGGGVSRIYNGGVMPLWFSDKLPRKIVRSLYRDADSVLWVGTYGAGLFRIEKNNILSFTEETGLYDNLVSHIVEDKAGRLWMGSNKGISAIAKSRLNAAGAAGKKTLTPLVFTSANGMINSETNGGFHPSAFADEAGSVWFPTVRGIVKIDAGMVKENLIPPPVYIEGLMVNQNKMQPPQQLVVSSGIERLQINYAGLSYADPSKNRYRYKLSGFSDQWFEAGGAREAIYTHLPPGEYTFVVTASNNDGVWSSNYAELKIIVTPPFWMTGWFLGAAAALVLGIIYWIYSWRMNVLRKRARLQEELARQLMESQESERKRIAGEIHDGMSQNILLMKNMAMLALENQTIPSETTEHLKEITMLAGETLDEARKMAHNLRPVQLDRLGLAETLRQLLKTIQKGSTITIEYEIGSIDGLLKKENEIIVFRILQELMNNILKHSGAKTVSVIAGTEQKRLRLFVQDDGTGFDVKRYTEDNEPSPGMGLAGIFERVRILKGDYNIKSAINEGTTIVITVPYEGEE